MSLQITLQNRTMIVAADSTVGNLAAVHYPHADILIVNGYPVPASYPLTNGDEVLCIRRGEIPSADDLSCLMAARHTPGVHQRLQAATIGIAGVGGLGSTIAVSLARIGVGRLVYADFDLVEPSNLNRQQYFIDQIGQSKVYALTETLARINPYITLEPHCLRLGPEETVSIFGACSIVLEAFDDPEAKAMLVDTVLTRLPACSVIAASGVAGYGDCNAIQTRRYHERFYLVGDGISEAGPGHGLMAPRVGVAAGHQANLVIQLLMEQS